MPVCVALLRGVNIGKANRVPMAEWRALMGDLGYTDVSTLLNSGNAVFGATGGSAAKHAAGIRAALATQLRVDTPVIVKTAKELTGIVSDCPIKAKPEQHSRLLVAFAQDAKALSSLTALKPLVAPPEKFVVGKQAAYLLCPAGIHESKAGAALLGKLGRAATTRNWATVLKLLDLVEQT